MRLLYRTGLRCSEALSLRPRDVQLAKREITVWKGKGDKDRVVWFDDVTAETVDRWRTIRPSSEWLFCTLAGGRLDDSQVRRMFRRRGRKAGIAITCHPHQLRHSFACELLEDGFSIYEVQKLLGHADLKTTEIYLHLVDEQLASRLRDRT